MYHCRNPGSLGHLTFSPTWSASVVILTQVELWIRCYKNYTFNKEKQPTRLSPESVSNSDQFKLQPAWWDRSRTVLLLSSGMQVGCWAVIPWAKGAPGLEYRTGSRLVSPAVGPEKKIYPSITWPQRVILSTWEHIFMIKTIESALNMA